MPIPQGKSAAIKAVGIALTFAWSCSTAPDAGEPESTSSAADAAPVMEECVDEKGHVFGLLPADPSLTPEQREGRCTWVLYTGGTEDLFRMVTIKTAGKIDALRLFDSRGREQRFKTLGLLNDPNCTQAGAPDQYGLWLDQCEDPLSAGAVGFRKLPNPKFDASKWSPAKYDADPATVEPPYLVGTACGSCHVAFDPLHPPADTSHPRWDNMLFAFGNQYLNEAGYFIGPFKQDDFRYHVLATQERGTSDTSRQATDHINNPNAINSIINLAFRPSEVEVMNDGTTQAVHHILKDGADSVGIAAASLRVYTNEGMCVQQWIKHHDLIDGKAQQTPVLRDELYRDCPQYSITAARMPNAAAFLMTQGPRYLKDAPGGSAYMTTDAKVIERGKLVFADNCATCHSSKQPPVTVVGSARKTWFRNSVASADFLDSNFLSDDRRHSITLLQTNAARALATNAKQGHIWQDYSSKTYKSLPSPGTLILPNPYNAFDPILFKVPEGGNGYYRTPTLVSVWATAPYLHNNALGKFNGDPSLAGRMDAFNDAITKLLWPAQRAKFIKRTSVESFLDLPIGRIRVPAGTPVNVLANIDPRPLTTQIGMLGLGLVGVAGITPNTPLVATALLKTFSQSPDLVEDAGHTFGELLSDDDKRALIEFVKTL
jgi:hypothetical protein